MLRDYFIAICLSVRLLLNPIPHITSLQQTTLNTSGPKNMENLYYDTFSLDPTPDVSICPSVDNCFFYYYNVSVMHNCCMDFRRHCSMRCINFFLYITLYDLNKVMSFLKTDVIFGQR